MNEPMKPPLDENAPISDPVEVRTGKKRYQRPAVRFERVFETSALSCGKVQTTQGACHSNRKTS